MKRIWVAALTVLAFGVAPVGAAGFVDEQYMPSRPPIEGALGWVAGYYDDGIDDVRGGSSLLAYRADLNTNAWSAASMCSSLEDPACAGLPSYFWRSYLPECADAAKTNCVAGVDAIVDGQVRRGTFERQFPETGTNDFTGDGLAVPDGQSPSLWTFPGVRHAGGDEFLVVATSVGSSRDGRRESTVRMSLYPVSVVAKSDARPQVTEVVKHENGTIAMRTWDERTYLFRGDGEVLQRWPFPNDLSFQLQVRLAKPLTGWLHGRVRDLNIDIADVQGQQLITVRAAPTTVPTVDTWARFADLPASMQDALRLNGPNGAYYYGRAHDGFENATLTLSNGANGNERAMRTFLMWLEVGSDKAVASKSSWTVRTMDAGEMGSAAQCFRNTSVLAGVVSTNATVYLSGPPTFNVATQTLDYKVAAPHFDRSGNVNIGTYTLTIRSDIARCVYGFSNAPISGTVQVVSADGQQQVATTNVKESNGWLYLTAVGYTYSSPTVRVTLSQQKAAASGSKKTITCVKGKTVKKVTAVAPKCPAGFKKR